MSQLVWGTPSERFYEIGVDRGVLYPPTGPGVVWNGLISVDENPDIGEVRSYYMDGVMYLQRAPTEEYEATITAMHRPKEFSECDGVVVGINGMLITGQRRKPFGFCYRSYVGNALEENELGYRLHLVYNALAMPSPRRYNTLNNSAEPSLYVWNISSKPVVTPGYKRTAQLVIDSLTSPAELLSNLEDILYGTVSEDPRLPSPEEIFEMGFGIIVIDNGDGSFSITAPDEVLVMLDSTTFEITSPSVIILDPDTYEISSF